MPLNYDTPTPGTYNAKMGSFALQLAEPKEGKHQTLRLGLYLPALEQTYFLYLCIDPQRVTARWNNAAKILNALGIDLRQLPLTARNEGGYYRFSEDSEDALAKLSQATSDQLADNGQEITVRLDRQGGTGRFADELELKSVDPSNRFGLPISVSEPQPATK